jgi:hypothetical protein
MIEFEGNFSIDISELKALTEAHFKTKRPPYAATAEQHEYRCRIDELHKKFLETFDGKFIKYGPCDWDSSLSSNVTFKKCYYNYVALKGFKVSPIKPVTAANEEYSALVRNFRIESCEKYVFDFKDSIHLAYHWEDFGVYTRTNCSIQTCFFYQAEKRAVKIWEITKEEFNKVLAKSFDLSTLSENFNDRLDARRAADEMAKKTEPFKNLNKKEKQLKEQIKLIKLRRDLLCQRQLLANSRAGVAMDNRDNIPEILEISASATIDQLHKEIKDIEDKFHKEGINAF